MEKEPVTAKELKEAAEILGTHTRDLLNSNINLKNQISYFERLRDAVVTASRVINEDLTSNEKLRAEAESLKNEIAGLEKTAKLLREDASKAKKDWQAETVKLEEVRQQVASLQSQVEAADVQIARGQEAARLLASIAAQ